MRLQSGGDGALKLLRGHAGLVEGLRLDQVAHSFRLGQVDAAVQEGAQSEFTRFCRPRALGQAALLQMSQNDGGAVAGNFHHVFCRVGMRCAKAGYHHLIEWTA